MFLRGSGQGIGIKAYRVVPRIRSVLPRITQENSYTMKFFIVLFAIVAAVSAGYVHAPQHIHVAGNPPIPGIQAHPLALKGNDHVTKIHYSGPHIGHPHLVGVEHFNPAPHYEPSVTNVKVHGKDWE